MSGGVPACIAVFSLVLNGSFSMTVILIVTLGCACVYWLARFCQADFSGSVVLMCHQLMVTLPDPPPAELPPQATMNNAMIASKEKSARYRFMADCAP
jgi:hypothetical protein